MSSPMDSVIHNRQLTLSALEAQLQSSQRHVNSGNFIKYSTLCVLTYNFRGCDMYLPGSNIHLQFQARDSATLRPLVAKIVKRLEPFTSSVVLLIQRISDNKRFVLKLNDRRLGYCHSLNMEDDELP